MLRDALSTANSWTAEDWGGFEALLVSIQGCVRGAFLLGMSKISFLDKIPVLLARLNEPGLGIDASSNFMRRLWPLTTA